ncbi:MAG: hypothetical protein KGI08_00235 [Thaumarchaeota archaeon]|nr:hypothetical protein [Nitrososphaerota archaeon]
MPSDTNPSGQRVLTDALASPAVGDASSILTKSGDAAQAVSDATPAQKFNQALVQMLQNYQLGTAKFQGASLQAQQNQAQAIMAPAQQGFSPSAQESIRQGQAGVFGQQAQAAQQLGQTFGEQIQGFKDTLSQARSLMQTYEDVQNKQRDDARNVIKDALTLEGGNAFQGADPQEIARLEKLAGYPKGFLQNSVQTIKERELVQKKQYQDQLNVIKAQTNAIKATQAVTQTDDIKTNAQSLIDGTIAPSLLTYQMRAKALAEAKRIDPKFNTNSAELKYQSAKRWIGAMNGSQMVRYQGLAGSVVNTIDNVKQLAEQMKLSGVPLLNKAKLTAYVQTEGNSLNGQLASQYLAAVNTLKEEFANLAQGGYAPTEAAWTLANSQINADYGVQQLEASLDEVQKLIKYRLTAIGDVQPVYPGSGTFGASAQTTNQPQSFKLPNGTVVKLQSDGTYK